ncbi:MAG: hypothetical protein J5I65_15980 [Aridibacter famidurans]|nr:hypothetical protein [Aridibacter famidurans]
MRSFSEAKPQSQKSLFETPRQSREKRPSWWTPLWQGLVSDEKAKHRKRMGSSIWLFLYLLTFANRKTGVVRRSLQSIKVDTGSRLRTINRDLDRLAEKKYVTILEPKPLLKLRIEKWKEFKKDA